MLDADPVATNGAAASAAPAAGDGDGSADTNETPAKPGAAETGAASPTDAAGEVPVAPKVRKIEGPATEPVDLAGVAGPAVLKRLLPIVAVLLVLLLVLRRRR
jgi:uncharacterized protein